MKIEDGKVIFTLANGKEFTLPMLVDGLAVGIGGSDLFYASPSDNSIDVTFASTMKEEDYKSIVATITNGNEADWIIKSRGAVDTWKVAVTEPTFTGTDGTYTPGSAKITITPPANVKLSDTALLTVTVTDANDGTISVSREVKYFDGEIVACTGGDLSIKGLDTSVKRLALKGSITVEDFKYIRESLTALEVLDISMTDLTELPDRALRFGGDTPNTSLKAVRLPLSMKTIGYAAFTNCRALTSIDTENVEIIGEWAFEQCRGLVEVKLHDGLKEIRRQAFTDCKNMESINMQRTQVKNILRNTYSGCSGITTFYYPNVVETIGEFAFSGCSALVGSFFPASLTSIQTNAFHLCTKMSQVYCLGSTPPTLGTAAFDSSLKSISTLFVPEAAISAYSSSSWNPYFKEIKKDLLHP